MLLSLVLLNGAALFTTGFGIFFRSNTVNRNRPLMIGLILYTVVSTATITAYYLDLIGWVQV